MNTNIFRVFFQFPSLSATRAGSLRNTTDTANFNIGSEKMKRVDLLKS